MAKVTYQTLILVYSSGKIVTYGGEGMKDNNRIQKMGGCISSAHRK